MNIITVTVNPAVDLHLRVDSLSVGRDQLAKIERRDVGGKGINVSRALSSYGVDNLCYFVIGRENGGDFISEMQKRGMRHLYTETQGYVRENINIHSKDSDTVIATQGHIVDNSTVWEMSGKLLPIIKEGDFLVFAGRISDGSDKEAILDFLKEAKCIGARLVIDSKSVTSDEIKELKPYLIKPNSEEAEALLAKKNLAFSNMAGELQKLCASGIENILLTLGADGGALITSEKVLLARVPNVEVKSTVGAGDSTIAGFLSAKKAGMPNTEALKLALAFGSAACMSEGTLPPEKSNINKLVQKITII